MLFVVVALAVVAVVPLAGGSYRALAQLRLRRAGLVAAALALQILIISILDIDSDLVGGGLHLVSYALVGTFVVLNRHVRWLWVVALGWASNTAAIAANGGVMPMSDAVARRLGEERGSGFVNSAPVDDPRLAFLGDVFVTPDGVPLQNSFSVGDVLLVVGLVLVVGAASRLSTATPARADRGAGADRA